MHGGAIPANRLGIFSDAFKSPVLLTLYEHLRLVRNKFYEQRSDYVIFRHGSKFRYMYCLFLSSNSAVSAMACAHVIVRRLGGFDRQIQMSIHILPAQLSVCLSVEWSPCTTR